MEAVVINDATSAIGMMTSAAATRDFVGSRAPALDIVWSSDAGVTSLEDLRGKVVLLEFWVTGCGHCIHAKPVMRELADRYRDSDVVIVGVTSVQGYHADPDSSDVIDTGGDSEREFALMEGFIESQGISWPIVFTRQSAWNPAYEVRGLLT